jgi:DNA excision repair protein ERCC-4
MEMVISKPFDRICKAQLEPVWNRLGSKPKQLLSDIKTLRLLLYYLIQYDCITFYKMLTCLKSHDKELGRSSGWLFLDAADELFTYARLRVYGTNMKKTYTKADLMKNRLQYSKEFAPRIIKESPKLKALKEVLEEIGREENLTEEINILIVGNDDRTCSQIKHFLTKNHLIFSKQTEKEAEEDVEKFEMLDEKKKDDDEEDGEEKDEEFIVKMILKPTSCTNGVEYVQRPQNERVKKILKKDLRGGKQKEKATVTLTQMVKRKAVESKQSDVIMIFKRLPSIQPG